MEKATNTPSLLNYILSLLSKNDSEKEKKEMRQYDKMKFVDVNKEIKKTHHRDKAKV